ncbi:MAG: DUF6488 family protein [Deferrisomatales bacterium]
MRTLTVTLSALLLALSLTAHAGTSGKNHAHGKPIDAAEAQVDAGAAVERLVAKGKLDASWKGVKAEKAEKKTFDKGPEWLVTFQNPAASDETKRTLYVFLTLNGDYVAANFTGK